MESYTGHEAINDEEFSVHKRSSENKLISPSRRVAHVQCAVVPVLRVRSAGVVIESDFCLARSLTGNVWRFRRQNSGNAKHFFDLGSINHELSGFLVAAKRPKIGKLKTDER
jgi:hypothetical protein